jgi:hypothetical protein
VVIDEAAFAKDGDNKVDGSMMEIWEKAIEPTLFDYGGEVLICSNSAGKNPDNFFYNICTDPSYGFGEFHATTMACNGTKMASAMMPIAIFLGLAARRWRIASGPPIITTLPILGGGHGEKTHRHSHGRRRCPRPQRGHQERDLSRQ